MQTVTNNKAIFVKIVNKYREMSRIHNRSCYFNRLLYNEQMVNKHYYDNLRVMTEIYYLILDWFECEDIFAQSFLDSAYEKAVQFKKDIQRGPDNPTEEELHIIQTFIHQMDETCEFIKPYISPSIREKYEKIKIEPRRSERIRNKLLLKEMVSVK
jgi:hypothetical protein